MTLLCSFHNYSTVKSVILAKTWLSHQKIFCFLHSEISLPAADGSEIECVSNFRQDTGGKFSYYGPLMPSSAIAGLVGDEAETFVVAYEMKTSPEIQPISVLCG